MIGDRRPSAVLGDGHVVGSPAYLKLGHDVKAAVVDDEHYLRPVVGDPPLACRGSTKRQVVGLLPEAGIVTTTGPGAMRLWG